MRHNLTCFFFFIWCLSLLPSTSFTLCFMLYISEDNMFSGVAKRVQETSRRCLMPDRSEGISRAKRWGAAYISSSLSSSLQTLIKVSTCEEMRVWTPSPPVTDAHRFISQPPRLTQSQFPLIANKQAVDNKFIGLNVDFFSFPHNCAVFTVHKLQAWSCWMNHVLFPSVSFETFIASTIP